MTPRYVYVHLSLSLSLSLYVYIYIYILEVGWKSVAATGQSFRSARAWDARCLDAKKNPDAKKTLCAFPFSLLAVSALVVRWECGSSVVLCPFPFSLRPGVDLSLGGNPTGIFLFCSPVRTRSVDAKRGQGQKAVTWYSLS